MGASARSRRGFPEGWRLSTGPPAPSHRPRAEEADVGKAILTLPTPSARSLHGACSGARDPGGPPDAGKNAGSPAGSPLTGFPRPGRSRSPGPSQARQGPGVGSAVLGVGCWAVPGDLCALIPAQHRGRRRALAADPPRPGFTDVLADSWWTSPGHLRPFLTSCRGKLLAFVGATSKEESLWVSDAFNFSPVHCLL